MAKSVQFSLLLTQDKIFAELLGKVHGLKLMKMLRAKREVCVLQAQGFIFRISLIINQHKFPVLFIPFHFIRTYLYNLQII